MAANYIQTPFSEGTQDFKKQYDSNIFVVFQHRNFSIKRGNTKPVFTCFVKQNGEQFGDALGAVMPLNTGIKIRIVTAGDTIAVDGDMTLIDAHLGEWAYTFGSFDFNEIGWHEGEIIMTDGTVDNVIGKFKMNVL